MIRRVCCGLVDEPCGAVLGFTDCAENGDSHGLCEYHKLKMLFKMGLMTRREQVEFGKLEAKRHVA